MGISSHPESQQEEYLETMTLVEVQKPNLTQEEMRYAVKKLHRQPNEAEWAMLEAEWSEHCSYKSSRQLLEQLPSKGPRVLIGPGFDAGVIDVGDNWVITLHIESHNHPSAIDPYGGAATGVGGVVRDILSLGTRPIALLDPLRFGSLESTHTRWLFDNVVRGIADYGNCVSGEDLVCFTNSDNFHLSSFGDFFDNFSKNKTYSVEYATETTTILKPKTDIRVLSFDFEEKRSRFCQVTRIYKVKVSKLLKIHTTLGRVISVTPDHPMFILKDGEVAVRSAAELLAGDEIPVLCDYPRSNAFPNSYAIDIIQELSRRSLVDRVTLRPATFKLIALKEKLLPLLRSAGVTPQQWGHYFRYDYLPLKLFLQLEKQSGVFLIKRCDLLIYLRGGRINPIPAVLDIDRNFARLIGYFLSEGCRYDERSGSGKTSRLIWTFREDETEYIDDVCSILKRFKVRFSKRQSSPSTVQVKVSSGVLGFVFREVLACGKDSYSKEIPSFLYKLHEDVIRELLTGIIRGDGSLRAKPSEPVGFRYATCSSLLFQQVLLLLQSFGYVAATRATLNQKSTVPLYELEIHGLEQVRSLTDLLSSQLRSKMELRLRESKYPKLAHPRFKRYEKHATVKVTQTEELTGNFHVYNFEVDGTHNFVTSGGIITHNCIGVPTIGGEVEFDQSFQRNCLVDVVCVGLGRRNKLVLAEAKHPGDQVYLIGGSTGRDGIRGASFASRVLTEKSDSERSAVQVPDPFMKKIIIEAVLEAVDKGLISGMKDLGGGGLTCGLSEMAAKAGTGMEIDLDQVRTREPGMQPAELLISESQERMLLTVKKRDEEKLRAVLDKWDVGYAKIGQVTRDGLLIIKHAGRIIAKAPAEFVAEAPLAPRTAKKPAYIDQLANNPEPDEPVDLVETLLQLLASPNIASKEWVYRQYDHEVGLKTVIRPGQADSAILHLPNKRSLAATTDGNSKQSYLDPYWGTVNILCEAVSNLVATGATPLAIVDHLQFGDPGNPEVYWTFKETVRAITDYLRTMHVPCVGGKVSFYNEDEQTKTAIKPTPVIAALGLRDPKTPWTTLSLKEENDDLILVGTTNGDMGGTEYYEQTHHLVGGSVSKPNLRKENRFHRAVLRAIRSGRVKAAHDVSKGGLATALAEMAIAGDKGFLVDLGKVPGKVARMDYLLFSENKPRYVLESNRKNTLLILRGLKSLKIPAAKIGTVQKTDLVFSYPGKTMISIPLSSAKEKWASIPRAMEATL